MFTKAAFAKANGAISIPGCGGDAALDDEGDDVDECG
eukprot:SAG22_NODE_5162_length_1074_cov_0.998974_1_plen_37_part_00